MTPKEKYSKHYEEQARINSDPQTVFTYADDFHNFSSHMNKSSWMMAGSKMETKIDEDKGQKVGSHITMEGTVMGIPLSLDEVVTLHNPPQRKEWETVGDINLVVIDHYRLGFQITPEDNNSQLRVYIDYNLPNTPTTRVAGFLLGGMYAKWCVNQMIGGVQNHFNEEGGK